MSIADKLKTVAQKIPDVYRTGLFKYAPKLTASGETILLENSAPEPFVSMTAYGHSWQNTTEGKNLYSGGNVTVSAYAEYMIEPIPIGTYTISAKVESSYSAEYYGILLLNSSDAGFYTATLKDLGNGRYGWTLDSTQECVELGFYVANSDASLSGYTTTFSDIQIEVGESATDYEPYTHGASPNPYYPQPIESAKEVKVLGGNLLDIPNKVKLDGDFYRIEEDGSISLQVTEYGDYRGKDTIPATQILKAGDYTLALPQDERTNDVCVEIYGKTTDFYTYAPMGSEVYVHLENDTEICFKMFTNSGTIATNLHLMLNEGNVALPFEPYKEPQTLTLPYELNGADGVYDEVDFERKKFIRRWLRFRPNKTIVFSGETSDVANRYVAWLPDFMENYIPLKHGDSISFSNIAKWSNWATGEDGTFCMVQDAFWYKDTTKTLDEVNAIFADLGTDVEIVAQLLEPIETDLTDEQIYAFKRLRANSPNTTIVGQGQVDVTYIVDNR